MRIKLFGEEHASTADCYRKLGVTQHKMLDYNSPLQSHQRALAIRVKLFGEEHESTADSYKDLGVTQHEMHDYTSALQSYQVHWLSVLNCLEKNMRALLKTTGNWV